MSTSNPLYPFDDDDSDLDKFIHEAEWMDDDKRAFKKETLDDEEDNEDE